MPPIWMLGARTKAARGSAESAARAKIEAHKKRGEAKNVIAIAVRNRPELVEIMDKTRREPAYVSDEERKRRRRFVAALRERIVEAYGEPLKQFYLPGTITMVLMDDLFPEEEEPKRRADIDG